MLNSFTKFKQQMSNILIIKHGSLGDIVQISGALKDIRETHKDKEIFILKTLYHNIWILVDMPLVHNQYLFDSADFMNIAKALVYTYCQFQNSILCSFFHLLLV